MRICIIKLCGNPVSERSHFEECVTCRGMYRYWYKKSPSDVIARREALEKWQDRMSRLVKTPKGKKHAKAIKG